jgi:mycothiol system anti-sigma-R factor
MATEPMATGAATERMATGAATERMATGAAASDTAASDPELARACSEACVEALERLEAYLDGELSEERIPELAAHLEACRPCSERRSFEQQLRDLVRQRCVEAAPAHLVERIRLRLSEELPVL